MAKKISGEYFKENRDFIPMASAVKNVIADKIDKKRLDTARKFMELQAKQKESRARIFKSYGIDMPLPDISEKDYLEKFIPMDAWLYSQYGAILYPQEDGSTKISQDGGVLIVDIDVKGKTLAEINGVPQKKDPAKEAAAPTPHDTRGNEGEQKKQSPQPLAGNERDNAADTRQNASAEPPRDVLAASRKKMLLQQQKKRSETLAKRIIIGSVSILLVLTVVLAAYKLLL